MSDNAKRRQVSTFVTEAPDRRTSRAIGDAKVIVEKVANLTTPILDTLSGLQGIAEGIEDISNTIKRTKQQKLELEVDEVHFDEEEQ